MSMTDVPNEVGQTRDHDSSDREARDNAVSLLHIVNLILRARRRFTWLIITGAMVAFLGDLIFGTFTAKSEFTPAAASGLASLASMAAQLGVDVSGLAATQTEPLDFWAQTLRSRDILQRIAQTRFVFATNASQTDTAAGTILDLYGIHESTFHKTLLAATKRLDDDITVKTDLTSGVVTVDVRAPWRDLAEKVNRELLNRLNDFNLHTRQSQAAAEAQFTADRMDHARAELYAAEDSLREFLENNRTYQSSPRLLFEESRLQRRVDLRQQIFTTLAQTYEQSRIEEVRDTPVLTLLEAPEGSAERTISLPAAMILGSFLGFAIAIGSLYVSQGLAAQRAGHAAEYEELQRLAHGILPRWLRRVSR